MRNKKDPGGELLEKIQDLLKNRLFVIIAGAILFIAVAGGVYALLLLQSQTAGEPVATGTEESGAEAEDTSINDRAEVLPQQRREDVENRDENEPESWTMFDPTIDPFSDPMRLTGTAIGGAGGSMAIIESSGTSYIVAKDDYVDDLWSVRDVQPDRVILRAHNKEVTLFLDQPPVTRSLDPSFEEDNEDDTEEEDQGDGD